MHKLSSTIIIFIIALVILVLFTVPQYQQSASLQSSIVAKKTEYYSDVAYNTKLSELIKSINEQKSSLEKVDNALPSDTAIAPLVYFFQKEAAQTGLTIPSMSLTQISPPDPDSRIRNITFTMDVSGSYQSFKNFLAALDMSAKLFNVNSVSFSVSGESSLALPNSSVAKNQLQPYDFNIVVETHTY